MANQPIPVTAANAMITGYFNYMTELGVLMTTQTQSVSFEGEALMKWLAEVMPFADELRVFMGIYPMGTPNEGRTTCILWPYLKGQPATKPYQGTGDDDKEEVEPFNQGGLNP